MDCTSQLESSSQPYNPFISMSYFNAALSSADPHRLCQLVYILVATPAHLFVPFGMGPHESPHYSPLESGADHSSRTCGAQTYPPALYVGRNIGFTLKRVFI